MIGPGGATIQDVRSQSGAHVQLSDALPGQTDRVLSLTGTMDQCHNAIRLSVMKLEVSPSYTSVFVLEKKINVNK